MSYVNYVNRMNQHGTPPEREAHTLQALLRPSDDGAFTAMPVSRRVNQRDAEGEDLWTRTEPLTPAEQLDLF